MQNVMDETNRGFMDRRAANHIPLTPLSFIARIAAIYPDREAVVYHDRRYSWQQTYERCVKLADALIKAGLKKGEVVTIMCPNTPEMVEAHFGVAMAGGVLNTMNTRLDTDTISYILDHAETRLLLTDTAFSDQMAKALAQADNNQITVIDIIDKFDEESRDGARLGALDYEAFIATGSADYDWQMPEDEWDAMALNYTSGTSGKPKGVVYHHRGAYLMAMGTIPDWGLPRHPRYLYIVPLFHCNGWGHAWMMAIVAGTIICCRKIVADNIFNLIKAHKVTHFGGAPIVLSLLVNAPEDVRFTPDWPVQVMTAGAPPPAAILEKVEAMGLTVTQVYGLTETYGHLSHCAWNEDWDGLDFTEQARIKARQGVNMAHTEAIQVLDQETSEHVPWDGETMGEVMFRSNCIMKGYHKNPDATEEALGEGYFKSGDLAVCHPNGYIEIKDRLKDIIISGGENISSVEVEGVLYRFPGVAFAAVVAKPDEKWGETPCAFLEMKAGETATQEEVIAFCREHLAGFKCPKTVMFTEIPKTSTGKLQKFKLRALLDS
jgi:fatty-acyl-CoA synthase